MKNQKLNEHADCDVFYVHETPNRPGIDMDFGGKNCLVAGMGLEGQKPDDPSVHRIGPSSVTSIVYGAF